ncbi:cupin domain [Melghiribacillus thermohalophilus]|uniref:Cupin domain n=1 Tax=Melghiribacillus thermohalophilus TaxID=1324956 RepID=A0A4R3MVC3_9BACI|nr:cupin domain-containing protein [Melghiribacillus thermohalophilus]TCT20478.1 cupin domain [Melghiribacillus thermohalophilus]
MQVQSIHTIGPDQNSPVSLITLFQNQFEHTIVKFGFVTIPPGQRVPLSGMSTHQEHEYSLVIKGSLITESGGKEYRISKGQATYIPAGESHYAFNDGEQDCEIVWVLVS